MFVGCLSGRWAYGCGIAQTNKCDACLFKEPQDGHFGSPKSNSNWPVDPGYWLGIVLIQFL